MGDLLIKNASEKAQAVFGKRKKSKGKFKALQIWRNEKRDTTKKKHLGVIRLRKNLFQENIRFKMAGLLGMAVALKQLEKNRGDI